jgi:hypothetical protein
MPLFWKIFIMICNSSALFWHYGNVSRKLRCMSCHIFSLTFQRFWIPRAGKRWFSVQKSDMPCHFLKMFFWTRSSFTCWYCDNKSRKSRCRPWHIFERAFNGFRAFIIRNYWKISIFPVSDSDTLWNRYFLTSIIAIRGTECRFRNWRVFKRIFNGYMASSYENTEISTKKLVSFWRGKYYRFLPLVWRLLITGLVCAWASSLVFPTSIKIHNDIHFKCYNML